MLRKLLVAAASSAVALATLGGCTSDDSKTAEVGDIQLAAYPRVNSDDVGFELAAPAGDGELSMPHLAIKQQLIGTTEEISYAAADLLGIAEEYDVNEGQDLKAPDGYEFVVVHLEEMLSPMRKSQPDVPATIRVSVDGEDTDTAAFDQYQTQELFLIVAKPDDEVLIQILDSGRVVSMDARTGEREPDAAFTAPYYPLSSLPVSATPNPPVIATANDASGAVVEITATPGPASLQPWVEPLGWAADGMVWLQIDGVHVSKAYDGWKARFSMETAFTITPAGGAAIPSTGPLEKASFSTEYDTTGVNPEPIYFAVPDDAESFTITFAPPIISSDNDNPVGAVTPGTADIYV